MKIMVSSTEAARNLGACLSRIKHTGDSYILTRNNRPVAELVPVAEAVGGTLGELVEALQLTRADADFADDLERVNRADAPLENPWR
jgi:prevent-host-death family protein